MWSNGAIGATWSLRYQERLGQYNDAEGNVQAFQPVLLLDGTVYVELAHTRVAVECRNMTNRHYYDYGGILMPGAWAKLCITAHL